MNLVKKDNDIHYSRRIRMFKEGYISVCVYVNVFKDGRKFYDTVIYRKMKIGNDEFEYKRGANLKPMDIPIVLSLLEDVNAFLKLKLEDEPVNYN